MEKLRQWLCCCRCRTKPSSEPRCSELEYVHGVAAAAEVVAEAGVADVAVVAAAAAGLE